MDGFDSSWMGFSLFGLRLVGFIYKLGEGIEVDRVCVGRGSSRRRIEVGCASEYEVFVRILCVFGLKRVFIGIFIAGWKLYSLFLWFRVCGFVIFVCICFIFL